MSMIYKTGRQPHGIGPVGYAWLYVHSGNYFGKPVKFVQAFPTLLLIKSLFDTHQHLIDFKFVKEENQHD